MTELRPIEAAELDAVSPVAALAVAEVLYGIGVSTEDPHAEPGPVADAAEVLALLSRDGWQLVQKPADVALLRRIHGAIGKADPKVCPVAFDDWTALGEAIGYTPELVAFTSGGPAVIVNTSDPVEVTAWQDAQPVRTVPAGRAHPETW